MLLAQVTFGPLSTEADAREAEEEVALDYFSSLVKNGQAADSGSFAPVDGQYRGFLNLSRRDAFERGHHSKWGVDLLDRVTKTFGRLPEWTILEDGITADESNWESATSLVLYTHAMAEYGSPIIRSDDGRNAAVFLLPISDGEREWLSHWAWAYRSHDAVWLHSSSLETAAYKEMVDPFSGLSDEGRRLGRGIEQATNLPTYYYLARYWGRRKGEEERVCPGCGGAWRVAPAGADLEWWQFPFRCDPCRLVSHDASTTDDERHARLGEFKLRRTNKKRDL